MAAMFDLGRLSDHDFEAVAHDLLEQRLGVPFELFGRGRDKGVDFRHMAGDQDIVGQCKHWLTTPAAALLRHLRKEELPKVRSVDPRRYVLVTSARITPAWKTELVRAFEPYITSTEDVFGFDDIQALLRQHPNVVRRHLKLWLSDSEVLRAVINQPTVLRSIDLHEEALDRLRLYVANPSLARSIAMLEDGHVCIVAGMPGIGKTTLAQVLAVDYANRGYELVVATEDVDEAVSNWSDGPQFFYYDDFLGQTSLHDKLGKNEDTKLLAFMRRVSRAHDKRLVLTTREYILEQARRSYARLQSTSFDPLKCVINVDDYTRRVRAEIVYNHVFFSELTPEQKAAFASPRVIERIIGHANFNPRLISFGLATVQGSDPRRGVHAVEAALDNPSELWEHIYYEQLGEPERLLLQVLALIGRPVYSDALRASWAGQMTRRGTGSVSAYAYKAVLRTLEGTMIRVGPPKGHQIAFVNPTLREWVTKELVRDESELRSTLAEVTHFEEIEGLDRLLANTTTTTVRGAIDPARLDEAIVTLIDRPRVSPTGLFATRSLSTHLPDRLSTAIPLTTAFNLPTTAAYVDRVLRTYFDDNTAIDLDACVRLASTALKHPSYREAAEEFVEILVEVLEEDNYGFDELTSALALLDRLEHPAAVRARDRLAEQCVHEVDEQLDELLALEPWADTEAPAMEHLLNMADELGYIDRWEDIARVRESYAELSEKIERPSPLEPLRTREKANDDAYIASMFDTLRLREN